MRAHHYTLHCISPFLKDTHNSKRQHRAPKKQGQVVDRPKVHRLITPWPDSCQVKVNSSDIFTHRRAAVLSLHASVCVVRLVVPMRSHSHFPRERISFFVALVAGVVRGCAVPGHLVARCGIVRCGVQCQPELQLFHCEKPSPKSNSSTHGHRLPKTPTQAGIVYKQTWNARINVQTVGHLFGIKTTNPVQGPLAPYP